MSLRKTIMSFLVALAVAMLPVAAFARERMPASDALAVAQTQTDSIVSAATADMPGQMDDCCLPHEKAGDPCSSATCCAAHCTAVAPLLSIGFVQLPKPVLAVPLIQDQVFASIIGAPPFRPPRV